MAKPRDDRQKDLLRPALEPVIELGHPLARLAQRSIGGFSTGAFRACARRAPATSGWWRGILRCRIPRVTAGSSARSHTKSDPAL
jgi:hypothetical protein